MGVLKNAGRLVGHTAGRVYRSALNRHSCNIVVACMPKSGSTYVWRMLMEVTAFADAHLIETSSFGQQDLCKDRIRRVIGLGQGSVSHIHLRATPENITLIRKYNLKPIVLTRNIFDIVPSLADHWQRESIRGVLSYVPAHIVQQDQHAIYDFIIANCLPWYFGFLIAWQDVADTIQPAWFTYEQFFEDQQGCLMQMLDHCGLTATPQQVQQAIGSMSGRQTRKNKGVAGRGDALLLPRQKDAIHRLAATWTDDPTKLACIGIG